MEKVFSQSWDGIGLTFNVAISQHAILLRSRKNYIIQIKNLRENDEYFNSIFSKFCTYSLDSEILTELVQYILSRLDFSSSAATNEDIGYLAGYLYAFVSHIISRGKLIKSKNKMVNISTDINKGVLAEG